MGVEVSLVEGVVAALEAEDFTTLGISAPTIDEDYIFDRSPTDFTDQRKAIISVWATGQQTPSKGARLEVIRDYSVQVRIEKHIDNASKAKRIADIKTMFNLKEAVQDVFEPNDGTAPKEFMIGANCVGWQETSATPVNDFKLAENIFELDLLFTFREFR